MCVCVCLRLCTRAYGSLLSPLTLSRQLHIRQKAQSKCSISCRTCCAHGGGRNSDADIPCIVRVVCVSCLCEYVCVVCLCVRARARVCIVCVCVRMCVCVCVCVCVYRVRFCVYNACVLFVNLCVRACVYVCDLPSTLRLALFVSLVPPWSQATIGCASSHLRIVRVVRVL